MGFTKLEKDVLNISKLPDSVKGNAKDLKATFDKAGEDIKEAHNKLIDELAEQNAASNIGAMSEEGATTVQAELDKLNKRIKIDFTELEVVVDDELNEESENAIQNKVVAREAKRLQENIDINNQYRILDKNYVDEPTSGTKYNKNYNLEGLGKFRKGQKLDVWVDNKLIQEKIFSKNGTTNVNVSQSYIDSVELDNGNIFIAYPISENGRFAIVTPEGKVVTTGALGSENIAYYISMCKLKNGNVFVAYQEANLSSDPGRFVIISPTGKIVKERTNFFTGSTYYISTCTLDNGNVWIGFRYYASSSSSAYDFVIYDQDGNLVKETTTIKQAGSIGVSKSLKLENGNIMAVVHNGTASQVVMFIYDQDGKVVVNETLIDSNISNLSDADMIQTPNKNVFILLGYYIYIYSENGTLIKSKFPYNFSGETVYNSGQCSINAFKNGNVLVAFADYKSNNSYGSFVVFDQEGNLIKNKIVYNQNTTYYNSTCLSKNGAMLIAYKDYVSSSNEYGKMLTVSENGDTYTNYYANVESNSINNIPVDTILRIGFYELVYDNGLFLAYKTRE